MGEKIMTRSGAKLLIEKVVRDNRPLIRFRLKTSQRCLLHWGLAPNTREHWKIPPPASRPEGTRILEGAAQTPFVRQNGEGLIEIPLQEIKDLPVLAFVLFYPNEGHWDNNLGENYSVSLAPLPKMDREGSREEGAGVGAETLFRDTALANMAEEIISHEMSRNSWTLMHRFNLAFDLLDRALGTSQGLALLFVWLRFSALRQLDWQRNYNTQPRELAHAMNRLAYKLTQAYFSHPGERELVRLILTTLGRGGEGQRIRDEILEIMHRHHIKEVSGQFLEEWHQKMHNNTTPDDIGICEAYLEFLRSNGNLENFYRKLEEGGITRKRLENFERPLRTPPDFVPSLKEALIHDFEHFLKTLKSVHGGADLETAIEAAKSYLDKDLQDLLSFIWHHRDESPRSLVLLIGSVTEARRRLQQLLGKTPPFTPDMLFLDLALEDFLRTAVERSRQSLTRDQLVEMIPPVLENRLFTHDDGELSLCLSHWQRLIHQPRWSPDWALHASAAVERLERAAGGIIDRTYRLFQPIAEFLGRAFKADLRVIDIFSEEVVRGTSVFVLSILLHHILPLLHQAARLGSWQVISRFPGGGQVEVVTALNSIQGRRFSTPTIIVADKVRGDEEIPPGVTAVLTPDSIDIVSHLAIRARNRGILLATCYEPRTLDRIKPLAGSFLSLTTNSLGEIEIEEKAGEDRPHLNQVLPRLRPVTPSAGPYAISAGDFREGLVGGKSLNLKRLQGRVPDWICLPASVALPFGVFEAVLRERQNRELADRYSELAARVDDRPADFLPALRHTVLSLEAPHDLISSLGRVMEESGLEWPRAEEWEAAWTAIKRVWASKWNERAYWSRRGREIRHENLFMAVLIQEVVEADYAFVIHTVNPVSRNRGEIYAEVVQGLGETLVGNYPGRALGFVYPKDTRQPLIQMYPSKSLGLYGKGLIFRSDSNGEDLADYAGAGLYDSVLMRPPNALLLDYAKERLVWEEGYRRDLLGHIGEIGLAVEEALGVPQDIEGAYARDRYHVVQTRVQVGISSA